MDLQEVPGKCNKGNFLNRTSATTKQQIYWSEQATYRGIRAIFCIATLADVQGQTSPKLREDVSFVVTNFSILNNAEAPHRKYAEHVYGKAPLQASPRRRHRQPASARNLGIGIGCKSEGMSLRIWGIRCSLEGRHFEARCNGSRQRYCTALLAVSQIRLVVLGSVRSPAQATLPHLPAWCFQG